jgi:hypothetical protein
MLKGASVYTTVMTRRKTYMCRYNIRGCMMMEGQWWRRACDVVSDDGGSVTWSVMKDVSVVSGDGGRVTGIFGLSVRSDDRMSGQRPWQVSRWCPVREGPDGLSRRAIPTLFTNDVAAPVHVFLLSVLMFCIVCEICIIPPVCLTFYRFMFRSNTSLPDRYTAFTVHRRLIACAIICPQDGATACIKDQLTPTSLRTKTSVIYISTIDIHTSKISSLFSKQLLRYRSLNMPDDRLYSQTTAISTKSYRSLALTFMNVSAKER